MSELTKITPSTAPVGARMLIKRHDRTFAPLHEVTVVEWAPSGEAVKLRYAGGDDCWERASLDDGVVVEILSPLSLAMDAGLDKLASGVDHASALLTAAGLGEGE